MTPQNPNKLFPLIVTSKLEETKHFYTQIAGFSLAVDTPQYLQVTSNGKDGPELCFMKPDAMGADDVKPAFPGAGLIISLPTPDADAKHAELTKAGAKPDTRPSNKPWGWRSFLVRDPNGVVLDFFHTIDENSM